ncbi:MAG TPA: hypothetical protein VNH19_01210 [Candidatus Limnocylindrales bacterium]|nr:hypothetical protein [Candidatus Limnocylindrales bacterium]
MIAGLMDFGFRYNDKRETLNFIIFRVLIRGSAVSNNNKIKTSSVNFSAGDYKVHLLIALVALEAEHQDGLSGRIQQTSFVIGKNPRGNEIEVQRETLIGSNRYFGNLGASGRALQVVRRIVDFSDSLNGSLLLRGTNGDGHLKNDNRSQCHYGGEGNNGLQPVEPARAFRPSRVRGDPGRSCFFFEYELAGGNKGPKSSQARYALRAVEVVRFELLLQFGRQFAKEIFFTCLEPQSLLMVHIPYPLYSAPNGLFVS